MFIVKNDDYLYKIYFDLGECTLRDFTIGMYKYSSNFNWYSNIEKQKEFIGIIKRLV